jgi:Ca-activated chloride channel family protein
LPACGGRYPKGAQVEIGNHTALYFLWVAALAAVLFAAEIAWSQRALAKLVSASNIPKVVRGYSRRRKILKRALIVACLALLVFAWAMPRVGMGMRVVSREGADIVVALDLSSSMMAEDVKPSRLDAAKHAAETLISRLGGNRIALVGFADDGFIYCPLTLDESALLMFLDYLGPKVVVDQGTNLGNAIAKSLEALKISTGKGRAIILITDGEDHSASVEEAVKEAQSRNVVIYTLGVGAESGEPIPVFGAKGAVTGYKRDKSDNVVISRLNLPLLKEIARGTGGESLVLGPGMKEITRIVSGVQGIEKGTLEQRSFEHYAELFQFPVGLALLLLVGEGLVSERRKNA